MILHVISFTTCFVEISFRTYLDVNHLITRLGFASCLSCLWELVLVGLPIHLRPKFRLNTSRHVTSCYVTSRHVTSRHVTSRHVTSRLRHVTSASRHKSQSKSLVGQSGIICHQKVSEKVLFLTFFTNIVRKPRTVRILLFG